MQISSEIRAELIVAPQPSLHAEPPYRIGAVSTVRADLNLLAEPAVKRFQRPL